MTLGWPLHTFLTIPVSAGQSLKSSIVAYAGHYLTLRETLPFVAIPSGSAVGVVKIVLSVDGPTM